ncbi:hypothetical protein NHX12_031123 [Muraenolepis orangiensis]|uniref:Uncharacterized protein n=1 Tax=Muraenolepis orangiensis TaxID=630683 RepID=A0A9Q0EAV5_9TELE|nr:hypothetical protein NHX12_031123 [Muraenolepis orangiensis]
MTSRQGSSFLPYPVSRLYRHPAMGGGTSSSSVFPSPVDPTPDAAARASTSTSTSSLFSRHHAAHPDCLAPPPRPLWSSLSHCFLGSRWRDGLRM